MRRRCICTHACAQATGKRYVKKQVRLARQSNKERQASITELRILSNISHRCGQHGMSRKGEGDVGADHDFFLDAPYASHVDGRIVFRT
eukprot:365282-Chlamydomonas_euryale.AAC.3